MHPRSRDLVINYTWGSYNKSCEMIFFLTKFSIVVVHLLNKEVHSIE